MGPNNVQGIELIKNNPAKTPVPNLSAHSLKIGAHSDHFQLMGLARLTDKTGTAGGPIEE